MAAGDIRAIGRATQGVRLIEMEEGDSVVVGREAGWRRRNEEGGDQRRRDRRIERTDRLPRLPDAAPFSRRLTMHQAHCLGRLELRVFGQQLLHARRC